MGKIKHIRAGKLREEIASFTKNLAVTHGKFEIDVPGELQDMEWNHMDQMHRPYIHHTYTDNIRIATGKNFALSLTKWSRWPLLITVSDTRVAEGIYYQVMTIAGMFYIHNVISMIEKNQIVHLTVEWYIVSHKWLKPLHRLLDRKFYRLNTRLQEEDAVIRSQRFALRQCGYKFASDPPDYLTANQLTNNTLYPPMPEDAVIALEDIDEDQQVTKRFGAHAFTLRKRDQEIFIWPSVCPHEGGNLEEAVPNEQCRVMCPWHGLKFTAAKLSATSPEVSAYGFSYRLDNDRITVRREA